MSGRRGAVDGAEEGERGGEERESARERQRENVKQLAAPGDLLLDARIITRYPPVQLAFSPSTADT